MGEQLLQHGSFLKRRSAREHEEQRAAKRVNIAPDIGVARIAGLLGTNVVERPERNAGRRLFRLRMFQVFEPRQAHVDQLRQSVGARG